VRVSARVSDQENKCGYFSNKQKDIFAMSDLAETLSKLDALRIDSARLLPLLQRHVLETAAGPEHGTWYRLLVAVGELHRYVSEVVMKTAAIPLNK
jgi:hypothetical protein